jgi:hypothetical protein
MIGPFLQRLVRHRVNLGRRETRDLDIEIESHETLQLDRLQLMVPARVEGQLVVGRHIGSPLCCIEVSEEYDVRTNSPTRSADVPSQWRHHTTP